MVDEDWDFERMAREDSAVQGDVESAEYLTEDAGYEFSGTAGAELYGVGSALPGPGGRNSDAESEDDYEKERDKSRSSGSGGNDSHKDWRDEGWL